MVDRRDMGSWLQGDDAHETTYAGERLGLPAQGPGSLAGLGPRVVALLIDWAVCSLIAAAFLGYRLGGQGATGFAPLLVFAVENVLLVGTVGFTLGHRVLGMRVTRPDGGVAGPVAGAIRTLLLCLVIPAVIWDRDQRGLHDRAAGTVLVRTR
ncbi:RDD family protein [Luteipulveratus sp. YIM 133132]|uniref:RDD family protein n=1 Tax=Luteipulveratus flavus TaxID=3031728 RepID=A0ABT6CAE7_9MICO|nr:MULTISPECIES: RDD family protein [unclassified Luteipulveratus]MDE9366460.1 RDD family protein [Luteipulveratus sp. YIM 133132]MDF8264266.1 RDD family protein [Luteipulveratus sp. YIM 133296]